MQAGTAYCRAWVNGTEMVVEYDTATSRAVTRRERLLGWPSRAWNRAWGSPPACTGAALITFLGAALDPAEIDGYCLVPTPGQEGFLLIPGARNFRGRCLRSTCERLRDTSEDALRLGVESAMRLAGRDPAARAAGVAVIAHSSGASYVTGPGAAMSGVGGFGSAITGALSAPAMMAAAAVTVAGIGTAVYLCSE